MSELDDPPVRGRPAIDPEEKRDELVQAALRVIQARGFEGASLRQIAIEAGCTTGVLTHYFANKEDLFRQLTNLMLEAMTDWGDQLVASGNVYEVLRQVLEAPFATGEYSEVWYLWYQLLLKARVDGALADKINVHARALHQKLEVLVSAAQSRGEVRDDQAADLLVEQIVSVTEGWSLMAPVDPGRYNATRREALVDLALDGLRPPLANGAQT